MLFLKTIKLQMEEKMNEQIKDNGKKKDVKKKLYKRWWFWVVVAVFGIAVMFSFAEEDTSDTTATDTETSAATTAVTEAETLDVDAYRKACKYHSYDELARNPDTYKGQSVKQSGKVMQVIEDGRELTLLVNVTVDDYGIYDDTVYITYTLKEGEGRILEDDLIFFYGTYKGLLTYTSASYEDITVPYVDAKHIELQTLGNYEKFWAQ